MVIKFEEGQYVVYSMSTCNLYCVGKEFNKMVLDEGWVSLSDLYRICSIYPYGDCQHLGWANPLSPIIIEEACKAGEERCKLKFPPAIGKPTFKPAIPKPTKDRKIQSAYNALTKAYCKKNADVKDYTEAMEEAIGYLGEVLE